ncbi:hypothetical protein ACJDU8_17725 [Clostridium sp. WILCCON 0269]|uniref:Uncharacterized protein n=1 Tax=Candidatus Clostridium eludens TaxID=3381663 RepID=A0ABW8SPV0_9CLOT
MKALVKFLFVVMIYITLCIILPELPLSGALLAVIIYVTIGIIFSKLARLLSDKIFDLVMRIFRKNKNRQE